MSDILPSIKILGTNATNAPKEKILEYIVNSVKKRSQKVAIVTPNPEILVAATRSKEFQDVLNSATVSLADGIGVMWAGSISKKPINERITGVDFMLELCKISVKEGFTIGLLGGRKGVAEKVSQCLSKKYLGLRVVMARSEWQKAGSMIAANPSDRSYATNYKQDHIDILFVAFGFPKQEEWIYKNLPDIDASVAMGVGGAFDYIAGVVPRAPRVLRNLGMEWAFRLIVQPWRIKRQMALPVFMVKILEEMIREIFPKSSR